MGPSSEYIERKAGIAATCGLVGLLWGAPAFALTYVDVKDVPAPINAVQLVYAPAHDELVLRNSASAVSVLSISSGQSRNREASYRFTDICLSPSGDYVFAADYGGENIGYSTPANPSSVHRVSLATGSWDVRGVYIAGNVQATADDHFVVKSSDQWISFNYYSWGAGPSADVLNASGPFNGYSASVYFGDFRYDYRSARLIHGSYGSSSQEIQAFLVQSTGFTRQEGTGTYGSAQGFGGSVALANDGTAFYYGKLAVDALDVTHTLHQFPELIYAATGDVAFGENAFYDAHSAAKLGSLAFSSKVYALNPHGSDFWVFDSNTSLLRHFVDTDATNVGGGGAGGAAGPDNAGGATNAGGSPQGGAGGINTSNGGTNTSNGGTNTSNGGTNTSDGGANTSDGGANISDGGASSSSEAGEAGSTSTNIGSPSAGHAGATPSSGAGGKFPFFANPVDDEAKACSCSAPGRAPSPWLAAMLGVAILAARTRRRVSDH